MSDTAQPKKRVEVAAAVITRPDGHVLLGQRAPGTFYPGYWEFPGGKVEPGEDARAALIRELDEELGINVDICWPWLMREHDYEHANVRLHFFEVPEWSGDLNDHVHSALAWEHPEHFMVSPMLPANGPILKALRLPRDMAVTDAAHRGVDEQLAALDHALAAGLKLVQVRDTTLDTPARERLAHDTVRRCKAAGAMAFINGDADLARRSGAHGLHLPARQLMALTSRPDFDWVGASCHSRAELEHCARLGLDYAVLGHVNATPSHPSTPALGWQRFYDMTRLLPMPVFAIGGVSAEQMGVARAAGAHGVAGIRGHWG
ncbi:Nudix family hydrolase [Denitromonas iodatirespirans]|uniref:8-oxo-dGTP diphosphatase n=1 Tax=Denitromonas iodatirespirans TaxID=2795389 RepID=A0A944DAB4_DENI1|nr:Nudix family hydrolase [Denitromonas iodatirespirans]MBT0962879.1 Nudix family hydrolase [Denitromonas iodatirespirans]